MKNSTTKFENLIGKKISAYGWHYDNGGSIDGTISSIVYRYSKYSVYVTDKSPNSMNDFSFTENELNTLLSNGELPEPNKFLNEGTWAKIF